MRLRCASRDVPRAQRGAPRRSPDGVGAACGDSGGRQSRLTAGGVVWLNGKRRRWPGGAIRRADPHSPRHRARDAPAGGDDICIPPPSGIFA